MERFAYAVRLLPAEEGGFVVTCRDLPALITQGEDQADALQNAADAMDEVFAVYFAGGLSMPAPTEVRQGEFLVSPPDATVAEAVLRGRDERDR